MRMKNINLIFYGCLFIAGLMAPWLGIYPVYLMTLYCYAIFACAFNLMLGYSGMLSFGHAAYFGFSSYITAHLITVYSCSTVVAILAGMLTSCLLGLVIGFIAIRRSGIYFAMITLALSQLVYFVCFKPLLLEGKTAFRVLFEGISLDWCR
jgi:branched-chain amino acid transport system permease protein